MGISTEEQETVITWSRGDKTAHIYTSDSVMMARLKKRQENNPEEYKNLGIGNWVWSNCIPIPCFHSTTMGKTCGI